ncbi:MAG: WD40 repeat domain-containing protein [Chloroflexota bacterium]
MRKIETARTQNKGATENAMNSRKLHYFEEVHLGGAISRTIWLCVLLGVIGLTGCLGKPAQPTLPRPTATPYAADSGNVPTPTVETVFSSAGNNASSRFAVQQLAVLPTCKELNLYDTVVFSPDGRLLAQTCIEGTLLWDVSHLPDGIQPALVQRFPSAEVQFSPDGRLLAIKNCPRGFCEEENSENRVELWDISTAAPNHPGQLLASFPLETPASGEFRFTSDSKSLIVAEGEQQVGQWDTTTFEKRGSFVSRVRILDLALNSQNDLLAISGFDGTTQPTILSAEIWDLHTGQRLQTIAGGWTVAFSPDGKQLLVSDGHKLEWWDARAGRLLTERTQSVPEAFTFSPDGTQLAIALQGRIELREVSSWRLLRSFCDSCQTYGLALTFSPDGRWLITNGVYNGWNTTDPIRLWEINTGQLYLELGQADMVALYPFDLVLAHLDIAQIDSMPPGIQLVQLTDVQPAAAAMPTPASTPPTVFDSTPQTKYTAAPHLTIQEYPLRSGMLEAPELAFDNEAININKALTTWPFVNPWEVHEPWSVDFSDFNSYYDPQTTVTDTNRLLQPFGYSLEEVFPMTRQYRLHKDNQVLDIFGYEPVVFNPDGTDFAWVVYGEMVEVNILTESTRDGWLVQRNGWQPITRLRSVPAYLGNQLLLVHYTDQAAEVDIDGQEVYTYTLQTGTGIEPSFEGYCPVRALEVFDGHWRLHTFCDVIIDGVSQSKQAGVEEIYSWVELGGEQFYLFRKSGQVGLSYAGQNLLLTYDDVYHTNFQISTSCRVSDFHYTEQTVWFLAQRDGNWYHVRVRAGEP